MALSARAAGVPVAIPAALPGRLARPRRLRLGDPEPYGHTVAASSEQGGYLHSTRRIGGGGVHVLASDQGRQATGAGRHSLILGGCLGALLAFDKSGVRRQLNPGMRHAPISLCDNITRLWLKLQ